MKYAKNAKYTKQYAKYIQICKNLAEYVKICKNAKKIICKFSHFSKPKLGFKGCRIK